MSGRIKLAQEVLEVTITVRGSVEIGASLSLVEGAESVVVMAYGSGSGRYSSRNCFLETLFFRIPLIPFFPKSPVNSVSFAIHSTNDADMCVLS